MSLFLYPSGRLWILGKYLRWETGRLLIFLWQKHNFSQSERLGHTFMTHTFVSQTGKGKSLKPVIPFANTDQNNLVFSQQQKFSSSKSQRRPDKDFFFFFVSHALYVPVLTFAFFGYCFSKTWLMVMRWLNHVPVTVYLPLLLPHWTGVLQYPYFLFLIKVRDY